MELFKIRDEITHNALLKVYPGGNVQLTATDARVFRERGWCEADSAEKQKTSAGASDPAENRARAVRRARNKVRDYALSNDFRWFVTLTIDKTQLDRYDASAIFRAVSTWLDNCTRRKDMTYLLVPEHHRDGAVHFHGLINDSLTMVDSGTLQSVERPRPYKPRSKAQRARDIESGARVVYNISEWKYGFSTAIELYGDRQRAVGYVCKYIGKDMNGRIGGRWYLSGGHLEQPEVFALDVPWDAVRRLPGATEGCFVAPGLNRELVKIDMEGEQWTEFTSRIGW